MTRRLVKEFLRAYSDESHRKEISGLLFYSDYNYVMSQ